MVEAVKAEKTGITDHSFEPLQQVTVKNRSCHGERFAAPHGFFFLIFNEPLILLFLEISEIGFEIPDLDFRYKSYNESVLFSFQGYQKFDFVKSKDLACFSVVLFMHQKKVGWEKHNCDFLLYFFHYCK